MNEEREEWQGLFSDATIFKDGMNPSDNRGMRG